jgi:hypothetical protein
MPLRRGNFRRRVWIKAAQAAGLPSVHFHDLRANGAVPAGALPLPPASGGIIEEDGITIAAPRKTSRDINRHKASDYG